MANRKLYFVFSLLFIMQLSVAGVYTPLDTANLEKRKEIAKTYLKKQKEFFKTLSKEFNGAELPYAKKILTEAKDEFHKEILNGDYIFEDAINSLVNSTVAMLQKGNANIAANADFYISRNITLNACSMADKSFLINLGSFYFLDNESQLAALVSHEYAHSLLKHQFMSIKKEYKMVTKEARSSISDVKKSRYGRGTKALEKYKNLIYANGKLNRAQEYEADSLGYIVYRNAGLKPAEYMNAFRLMFEYDTIRPIELDTTVYRKVFNLPEQKFKPEWLKMEDFSGYDYSKYREKFSEDSLKSHPGMKERIARLESLFPELKQQTLPDTADAEYAKIQKIARYERFSSLDINEDYGFGVFLCLVRLSKADVTDKEYYEYWLGKYFGKILNARKDYTLNRYLDRVDPKNQPHSYQQFLNFMWNLKIPEIEVIAKHYTVQ